MLKIGSKNGSECPKCIYWNAELGCEIIQHPDISKEGDDVFCLDGIEMVDELGQDDQHGDDERTLGYDGDELR